MHVGNAFSAIICQQWAEQQQAELYLRIEDIDHTRCKPHFSDQLLEDLQWLGLQWHGEVQYQSMRSALYDAALQQLYENKLIYPCFCTRKSILQDIERIGLAPHADEHNTPYPGTCRELAPDYARVRMQQQSFAWRLHIHHASMQVDAALSWLDEHGMATPVNLHQMQDIVIGRKDIAYSYHLAVVVDDADQGITHVIRGEDLRSSTPVHRLLQALLQLPSPIYIHHKLLHDPSGQRLAKRNQSTTLQSLRQSGIEPEYLRQHLREQARQSHALWHGDFGT